VVHLCARPVGDIPHRVHVVTAKAGLVGMTRGGLAHELSPAGITVNCVAPGLIATERQAGAPAPQHHASHSTPVGRRGQPAEIGEAKLWLTGPGGRYVTGQVIHLNGGAISAAEGHRNRAGLTCAAPHRDAGQRQWLRWRMPRVSSSSGRSVRRCCRSCFYGRCRSSCCRSPGIPTWRRRRVVVVRAQFPGASARVSP
jgi:hypothetical protein